MPGIVSLSSAAPCSHGAAVASPELGWHSLGCASASSLAHLDGAFPAASSSLRKIGAHAAAASFLDAGGDAASASLGLPGCRRPATSGAAASFFEFEEPCQRWKVNDNLHDIVQGITNMRTEDIPWAGYKPSPPLRDVSPVVWKHLKSARRQLREVHVQLLERMVQPSKQELSPDQMKMWRKDRPRFYSYVPQAVLERMQGGLHELEAAVVQQKQEQFQILGINVDAAEKERQTIALRELLRLGVEAVRAAERCSAVPPTPQLVAA
eukprot:TRINITY_DN91101_c0_g1_i1.p1 TRINITY_DN91101_c0_g1~~TRINITY_DN91101_c0_g1_i1.p1  ORF type:complete len:266 (+),score=71.86 TRINITY_DN91101_c0_g1_i1:42-839(+)